MSEQSLDAASLLSRSTAPRWAPSCSLRLEERQVRIRRARALVVWQPGSAELGIKPPGSWAKQIVTVPVWASPSLIGQPGPSPPHHPQGGKKGAPLGRSQQDARNCSAPHAPAVQPLPSLMAESPWQPQPLGTNRSPSPSHLPHQNHPTPPGMTCNPSSSVRPATWHHLLHRRRGQGGNTHFLVGFPFVWCPKALPV